MSRLGFGKTFACNSDSLGFTSPGAYFSRLKSRRAGGERVELKHQARGARTCNGSGRLVPVVQAGEEQAGGVVVVAVWGAERTRQGVHGSHARAAQEMTEEYVCEVLQEHEWRWRWRYSRDEGHRCGPVVNDGADDSSNSDSDSNSNSSGACRRRVPSLGGPGNTL